MRARLDVYNVYDVGTVHVNRLKYRYIIRPAYAICARAARTTWVVENIYRFTLIKEIHHHAAAFFFTYFSTGSPYIYISHVFAHPYGLVVRV